MKIPYIAYNLQIMDVLFLILFLGLLVLLSMVNIRKQRIRIEEIEKQLGTLSGKKS